MVSKRTELIEFQCPVCGTRKEAYVPKDQIHEGQLKTVQPCGECNESRVWEETGWIEIEVE